MTPIDYATARGRLYLGLALAHAAIAALVPFSRMSVDWSSFAPVYVAVLPFLPVAYYAGRIRATRVTAALDVLIAGWLIVPPIVVSTYLAISVGRPLADGQLIAWDAALGFDWRAFIAFIDARRTLSIALAWAYSSFFIQLLALPLFFALVGQPVRACAIVFAYCVLCLVSSAISIEFPALGSYVSYGVSAADVVNINAKFGFHFLEQFHAVRDQPDFVLRADAMAGILTFPSVHAGVAFLCAWAAWPNRWLRIPFLVLDLGMAIAAISHANHYLVDVFAGGAVAAFSIWVAKAAFFTPAKTPALISTPAAAATA